MVTIVSKDLLQRERIAVGAEGDFVRLDLGNVTLKLRYEDAFLLSQWIRMRAKEAKRNAGDTSHHWSLLGVLKDFRG